MNKEQIIFYQAALFRCSCCNYEAEIYCSEAFLTDAEREPCDSCNQTGHFKFSPVLINRDDLDDIVLHPQFASLAEDKNKCIACLNVLQVNWKALVPRCIKCDKEGMHYVYDVEGKNIKLFAEWCRDWAKPSHPNLLFIDAKGSEIFYINGIRSKFSAT